jgi:hypothetical protein
MNRIRLLVCWSVLSAVGLAVSGCYCDSPGKDRPRTLAEAREITLNLFRELDAFRLEKQTEVGLSGHSAVRMEASWKHGGQRRRGIIYIVDHPNLFNVIHYTAPSENNIFDAGYPEFQRVVRNLKSVPYTGKLTVEEEGEEKIIRSSDLQLEIRYPSNWVYSLDEVNRAIVFSGPRSGATWLTTINFSVIQKWGVKK